MGWLLVEGVVGNGVLTTANSWSTMTSVYRGEESPLVPDTNVNTQYTVYLIKVRIPLKYNSNPSFKNF